MYQRILLATDGSKLSRKAQDAAVSLAAATGAQLLVFSAAPKLPKLLLDPTVFAAGLDRAEVDRRILEAAQKRADKVCEQASREGVVAKAVIRASAAIAESILAEARKSRCDVIVMASHGRQGMDRLLLGSETQKVLAGTHTPVLVVR